MATLTVSGTVTDAEGNVGSWSTGATIGTTLLGSSFGVATPGGQKVQLGRAYLQPGDQPTTYSADSGMTNGVNGTAVGGTIWISPKVSSAGTWFASLVNSFPADRKVLCSPWHEPENDGTNGHDLTDYTNTYASFRAAIDNANLGARVTLLPILMKSKTEALNRTYMDAVRQYVTACGYDAYNTGIHNPSSYDAPSTILAKPLSVAASYGLPLWIGETGSGLTPSDSSGSQRCTWATSLQQYAKSQGVAGISWFSSSDMGWTTPLWSAWNVP